MISTLFNEDPIPFMKKLKDGSIDLVFVDLPSVSLNKSNKNAEKLNNEIPLLEMWHECKRIIKENGNIVFITYGMQTADVMITNRRWWKYNLVWKSDNKTTGFLEANNKPLINHRDICVFAKTKNKKQIKYNPQMTVGEKNYRGGFMPKKKGTNNCYGELKPSSEGYDTNLKFPITVLNFTPETGARPTQKPLALLDYIVRTYSNEGDTVLDFAAKFGDIGKACIKNKRKFIGVIAERELYVDALQALNEFPLVNKVTDTL